MKRTSILSLLTVSAFITFTSPAADEAKAIDGFRWEFPCVQPMPDKPRNGANCKSAVVTGDPKKTDNFSQTVTFGGDAAKTYLVTIRFRGVVEPMMYKDGEKDGEYFYKGGLPNNKTYNIYQFDVSKPAAHFYLNRQDKVGHKIFTIDYTRTIEIAGGAILTLSGDGQNGLMISNFKKLQVEGIDSEKPYNGQYVQMDVVSVAEKK
jgi:hypothetical protein